MVTRATGAAVNTDEASLARSLAAHLLLCDPVPIRPWDGTGPVHGPGVGNPWSITFEKIHV